MSSNKLKNNTHSTSSVPQILDSATALASWGTQTHSAPSVEVRPMPHLSCSPGRNTDPKWTSGPCEFTLPFRNVVNCCQILTYLNTYFHFISSTIAEVFILVLQWCEHVCDVDWDSSLHCGALQSPGSAPENGRQGDESSTSLTLYR